MEACDLHSLRQLGLPALQIALARSARQRTDCGRRSLQQHKVKDCVSHCQSVFMYVWVKRLKIIVGDVAENSTRARISSSLFENSLLCFLLGSVAPKHGGRNQSVVISMEASSRRATGTAGR